MTTNIHTPHPQTHTHADRPAPRTHACTKIP